MKSNLNVSKAFEKSPVEQRDVLIAQLKAENFELKHKEKEMISIQIKITEIEKRIDSFAVDKSQKQKVFRQNEESLLIKIDKLKGEINMLNDSLTEKNKCNKSLTEDVHKSKEALEKIEIEVGKNSDQASELDKQHSRVKDETESLLKEYNMLLETKKQAHAEISKLIKGNRDTEDKIDGQRAVISESEVEIGKLTEMISKGMQQLTESKLENKDLQGALDSLREERKKAQIQLDSVKESTKDINGVLESKIHIIDDTRQNISKCELKLKELEEMKGIKDKQISENNYLIGRAEKDSLFLKNKCEEMKATINNIEQETVKIKQVIQDHQKQREKETESNVKLLNERAKIEKEKSNKDDELLMLQKTNASLSEECAQLAEENHCSLQQLAELKEHVEILQDQNDTLNRELDKVVEADEIVKRDLNRKTEIEAAKQKSTLQVEKSFTKLKGSRTLTS